MEIRKIIVNKSLQLSIQLEPSLAITAITEYTCKTVEAPVQIVIRLHC